MTEVTATRPQPHPERITVLIDHKAHTFPSAANPIKGEELYRAAGVDPRHYDLWLRQPCQKDDELIEPSDEVILQQGQYFYTAKKLIQLGGHDHDAAT